MSHGLHDFDCAFLGGLGRVAAVSRFDLKRVPIDLVDIDLAVFPFDCH